MKTMVVRYQDLPTDGFWTEEAIYRKVVGLEAFHGGRVEARRGVALLSSLRKSALALSGGSADASISPDVFTRTLLSGCL